MTTQVEFTGEILRSGADLLRNAEFAVEQGVVAVGLVAGERALMGSMDDEQRAALQDFVTAFDSLRTTIESVNGGITEHLPDAQLPLGEGESDQVTEASVTPELGVGEVNDPNEGSSEAVDPTVEDEQTGEPEPAADDKPSNPETEDEEHEGRYRQERVLRELFGPEHATEIRDLPIEKIQRLGEVAAAFYAHMELHPRAVPARDERVDMIKRFVANGEPSGDIAKDYGLTPSAPQVSIRKAVEIMVRDLPADDIEQAYRSVVNS